MALLNEELGATLEQWYIHQIGSIRNLAVA